MIWHNLKRTDFSEQPSDINEVIHEEMFKRWKFDSTSIWYKYKTESALGKETLNVIRDFKIHKGYPIPKLWILLFQWIKDSKW